MFSLITEPMAQLLTWLISLTGNLGWAIIALTVIVRTLLVPLTLPAQKKQIKARHKMKELQPEIAKLKKKHKNDRLAFSQAQMELMKEHGVNMTLSSLLLPLSQIVFLIALFSVLQNYLKGSEIGDPLFFGLHLVTPDKTYILPILAGILQLILSAMLLPGLEGHDLIPDDTKNKKLKKANAKEEDTQEMAETMMQQSMFILPVITVLFSTRFPAGVALYWVATTAFSLVQQYAVSGWGGLARFAKQARTFILRNQ